MIRYHVVFKAEILDCVLRRCTEYECRHEHVVALTPDEEVRLGLRRREGPG